MSVLASWTREDEEQRGQRVHRAGEARTWGARMHVDGRLAPAVRAKQVVVLGDEDPVVGRAHRPRRDGGELGADDAVEPGWASKEGTGVSPLSRIRVETERDEGPTGRGRGRCGRSRRGARSCRRVTADEGQRTLRSGRLRRRSRRTRCRSRGSRRGGTARRVRVSIRPRPVRGTKGQHTATRVCPSVGLREGPVSRARSAKRRPARDAPSPGW